jgi:hypothetical protein
VLGCNFGRDTSYPVSIVRGFSQAIKEMSDGTSNRTLLLPCNLLLICQSSVIASIQAAESVASRDSTLRKSTCTFQQLSILQGFVSCTVGLLMY